MNENTNAAMAEGLAPYREQIDRIDKQIIELLEERFDVVTRVAEYKQRKGWPILDAQREQEKLAALESLAAEEKRPYTSALLQEMMAQSRQYQKDHPLRYGLLGRTLGHSHSPRIHGLLGGYRYGFFEREPEQLPRFFQDDTWRGISVTMPYKRDVMAYCDELSDIALACNSVNTILRRPKQRPDASEAVQKTHAEPPEYTVFGTNTDYEGFRYVAEQSGIDVRGCKTLVLGSGGVSGTVVRVMEDLGADPVIVISRSGENNYANLERHEDAKIIVNTTPVGMYPHAGEAAVDIRRFPSCRAVFDLIYNPLRTKLMLDAEAAGIPAFGGLPMLVAQAAKAVELFAEAAPEEKRDRREGVHKAGKIKTGEAVSCNMEPTVPEQMSREAWIEDAHQKLWEDLEDIVLIGMPGAGKTSVGRALAAKLDRPFIDMDEMIRIRTGQTPEAIIRKSGIDAFRRIETEITEKICQERLMPSAERISGPCVIATGGGCVEREENRDLIRENARVIWLRRPLEDLPVNNRPVSQADGLRQIYQRRRERYEAWSDLQADCIGVEQTADLILQML